VLEHSGRDPDKEEKEVPHAHPLLPKPDEIQPYEIRLYTSLLMEANAQLKLI